MKSAQGYRSWCIKIFLFFSSDSHLVNWNKIVLAILVEGDLSNIPVKVQ